MNSDPQEVKTLRVSKMAETLKGSEIVKLGGEINERIKRGERINNLTIGDFNPRIFPIPEELREEIKIALDNEETNYPPADGMPELKTSVLQFIKERENLNYSPKQILLAGGARPLIYALYRTLIDNGDGVIFPVPSWNNNHYSHLVNANAISIKTTPENNFMPTAVDIRPHLKQATLVALCSPLNPTGTTFSKKGLEEICEAIIEENKRRKNGKPLYLMYDQIYWVLTFGKTKHHDPVSLAPEMKEYTIYIDGISKSFAATGLRIGWALGPQDIIDKIKAILSHVGAWAPRAEQVAAAKYLEKRENVDAYLTTFKQAVQERLDAFYNGFMDLKRDGFRVDAIAPQAAIYLTANLDVRGMKKIDGGTLKRTQDITKYFLDEAQTAFVPFSAFGDSEDSTWYRLSVGTCKTEDVGNILSNIRNALEKLS